MTTPRIVPVDAIAIIEAERKRWDQMAIDNPERREPQATYAVAAKLLMQRLAEAAPTPPVAGGGAAPIEDGEAAFWAGYLDDRDEPPADLKAEPVAGDEGAKPWSLRGIDADTIDDSKRIAITRGMKRDKAFEAELTAASPPPPPAEPRDG